MLFPCEPFEKFFNPLSRGAVAGSCELRKNFRGPLLSGVALRARARQPPEWVGRWTRRVPRTRRIPLSLETWEALSSHLHNLQISHELLESRVRVAEDRLLILSREQEGTAF